MELTAAEIDHYRSLPRIERAPPRVRTRPKVRRVNSEAETERRRRRGLVVKEVMQRYGLDMPAASRLVREKGLYP
jgi:hypothetical protein